MGDVSGSHKTGDSAWLNNVAEAIGYNLPIGLKMSDLAWSELLIEAQYDKELIDALSQIEYEAERLLCLNESKMDQRQVRDEVSRLVQTHASADVRVAALDALLTLRMLTNESDDTWVVGLMTNCNSASIVIGCLTLLAQNPSNRDLIEGYVHSDNSNVKRVANELIADMQGS